MQTTSELYQTLLADPGHVKECRLLVAGEEYASDRIVSMETDGGLFEQDTVCAGCAVSRQLDVVLYGAGEIPKGARLIPEYRLRLGDQVSEWVRKGVFYIDTREPDAALGTLTIHAFDDFMRMEAEWVPAQDLTFPMPMDRAAAEIARYYGLSVDPRSRLRSDYFIDYPTPGTNGRTVFRSIAAAHGGNWTMTDTGEARLVRLNDLAEQGNVGVGTLAANISVPPALDPITKIVILLDDDTYLEAGNDNGRTFEVTCPYGTQEMADNLLKELGEYRYRPMEALDALIDPAAELGDGVVVGGVCTVLAQMATTFDALMASDIGAPGQREIESETGIYTGPVTQKINRKLAQARSYIDKTASELRLGVERLVGGVQILRGTNSMDGLGSGEWSAGTWRVASSGTGTREKIAVSDPPVPGIRSAWRITRTAGNVDVAQDAVPVTDGATYTLSCYARGTGALRMEYGKGPYRDKKFETISGADWSRYSFTFTVGEEPDGSADGTTNIYVGNSENGALDICGVKLERGLAATDWCLSPEEGGSPPTAGTSLSELRAELELKIGRDENNRIVSMLNASADTIHIKGNRFVLESTNFSVTADGVLTAKSGTIGGWTINNYKICGGTKDTGVAVMQMPSPIVTWVFAAGGTSHDSYADCPFRVSKGGELHATNAYITGNVNATSGNFQSVTISGSTFSGSLSSATGTFTGSHKSGTVSSCNLGGTSLLVDEGANAWVKVHTAAAKDSIQVHGEGSAVLSAASHAIMLGPERVYTDTNFYAEGDISCGGKKSRAIDTEHYGTRCLDAFETPLPTFGDFGTGRLDESGVCCMFMDPVFMETVDPNYAPTVILTKYGEGDIWYDRDASDHDILVVCGTPGLAFAWQVMYAQTNAEIQRLRVQGYDYKDMSAVVDYESENMVDWEHSPENVDYAEGGAEYLENFERSLEA